MEYPWMVKAKLYMGLKEIPGPKHNPTIVGWLEKLNAWWMDDETPWCFTGDTEIMAEDGWVKLIDIKENQRVYQVDDNRKLSITPIISKIEKDYNGDVFDINSRSLQLTCDVGHKWWGNFQRNNDIKEFRSLNDLSSNGIKIPSAFSNNIGTGLTRDQLYLLAAFISDGKLRYSESKENSIIKKPLSIEFEVSRERKVKLLYELGPDTGYKQKRAYGPLTITPLNVFVFKYPDWFDKCFKSYKVLSNEFINSLSVDDARTFLEAYAMFDGNGNICTSSILYTSDKENLDNLITIAILAGYYPNVKVRKDGSALTKKTAYTISFTTYIDIRYLNKSHITKRNYEGKLYCVEVPEGRIVVRGKNLSPVVTGNCGSYCAHCFRSCNIEIPNLWMRAKDWESWGSKLDNPTYGCIVTFSRQGGGHVGFVVGQTKDGSLLVLGGNQSNSVNIMKFDKARVTSYRWPKNVAVDKSNILPTLEYTGPISTNEA